MHPQTHCTRWTPRGRRSLRSLEMGCPSSEPVSCLPADGQPHAHLAHKGDNRGSNVVQAVDVPSLAARYVSDVAAPRRSGPSSCRLFEPDLDDKGLGIGLGREHVALAAEPLGTDRSLGSDSALVQYIRLGMSQRLTIACSGDLRSSVKTSLWRLSGVSRAGPGGPRDEPRRFRTRPGAQSREPGRSLRTAWYTSFSRAGEWVYPARITCFLRVPTPII